jgi:transcriptional antiterminator RfaH
MSNENYSKPISPIQHSKFIIQHLTWKVLYVSSRSEKKVDQRLRELGVESYVPLKREKRKWSDRMKWVSTPMISGYVFVKVDEKNRDQVFRASGVLNYVRYNGGDAMVRDAEIHAMQSIEEKGYHVEIFGTEKTEIGDAVEIKYGPFKGLHGKVLHAGKEEEHTVQIEGIGYALRVTLPSEVLEKIQS